jgi:hypothetical protein
MSEQITQDGVVITMGQARDDWPELSLRDIDLSSCREGPIAGLRELGPITISGYWESASDAPSPYTLTIDPKTLPRKTKRFLMKLTTGQKLGRREAARGVTVIVDGVRVRITPDPRT